MMPPAPGFRTAGTSQAERQAPALLAAPPLDGRGLPELLAYAARLSGKISFYQHPDETPAAPWELARHQRLLLLAVVAAQPSSRRADEYSHRLRLLAEPTATPAQRQESRQELLLLLHQEADQLLGWCLNYRPTDGPDAFAAALRQALADLLPLLQQAARYESLLLEYEQLSGPARLGTAFLRQLSAAAAQLALPAVGAPAGTSPIADAWRQTSGPLASRLLGYVEDLRAPGPAPGAVADLTSDLTWLFWQVHKAQTTVQHAAAQELPHSLATRHDHHPEIGLLVTFLQLYGHTQQALNALPQRHLTHYYEEVLQTKARPSQPDTAYLAFHLARGCQRLRLPAGTLVGGGKDAQGRRIVFATAADAELSAWQVETLATLLVARQPGPLAEALPALPPGQPAGLVTGVYTTAPAGPTPGLSPAAVGWPLFGQDPTLNQAVAHPSVPARLGFAVAAAVLCLGAGQRTIELELQVQPEQAERLRSHLAAAPLSAFLAEAFRVQATGPAGWVPAAIQAVRLGHDTLTWTVQLGRTQPAVVAYDAARHGGSFATAHPMLQLLLNPQAATYAYSYLAGLEPVNVTLRVSVRHLHDVGLANQLGRLSNSAPFYPFGAQAMPGNYLAVSVPELMEKDVQDVTLALTWQNLPAEGFAAYYAGYGVSFAATDFVVTPGYLAGYHWQPAPPQHLFQPESAGPALKPLRLLHLHGVGRLTPAADGTGGLLRLVLTGPAQGFGAQLYPTALATAVRHNARNPTDLLPLPQPPFVPQLNHLTVSYQARETFYPGLLAPGAAGGRFFHLHPLAEYEPAGTGPLQLLPSLPDEGTLLVSLGPAAAGQLVHLVFDLTVPQEADQALPTPQWAYLYHDEWHPVPAGAVSATLPGFAASCQVQVQLPAGAGTTTHTLLPTGRCWLRATVPPTAAGAATQFGQVRALYAQLVPAVRTVLGSPPAAPYQEPLPAGRLTHLPRAVPGIAGVGQPLPSFGGRVAEDRPAYYTRVSEQLRHRSRALVPWDYERLVLERFPDVYSAKCLAADQLPKPRVPGQVVVVVLPRPRLVPGHPRPLFGAGQLAEIRQYLQQLASATAHLAVCNASYELVQVRGWVQFKAVAAGRAAPHYEQQLQRDLSAFLAPWQPQHPQKGGFHRHLTLTAIRAFLHQLPYLENATGISVVKTGLLDGRHRFYDSAAPGHQELDELGPLAPGAVLVSADQHALEAGPGPGVPQPTGVGQLRIGQDFVVACDF